MSRILQWGEDRRFDKMRDNLGKLAFFWTFQVPFATCVLLLDLIVPFLKKTHQAVFPRLGRLSGFGLLACLSLL